MLSPGSFGIRRRGFLEAASVPGIVGVVPRDLGLERVISERVARWLMDLVEGRLVGGTGESVLIYGPGRNDLAGALVTAALAYGALIFDQLPVNATPVRCMSSTGYLTLLRVSYGDRAVAGEVQALRGYQSENNVLLMVLTDLGEERGGAVDFTRNEIWTLLKLRAEKKLPTIVTTRRESRELAQLFGDDVMELLDPFVKLPLRSSEERAS